jgi:hypothetical protein
MTALFVTVFLASLLGSLHCAGMCGAFLAIAVGNAGSMLPAQLAYHTGRLTTYLILGAVAGTLGRVMDLTGALAGIQPVAVVFAAVFTVGFAAVNLMQLRGIRLFTVPPALTRVSSWAHRAAMSHRPIPRALLIGLATTLLPCGWLYAFAAVAAGTASPPVGAAVMLAFWFGTLPVMTAVGLGVRGVLRLPSARLAVISCAALIVVGAYTVAARAQLSPRLLMNKVQEQRAGTDVSAPPPCCSESDARTP